MRVCLPGHVERILQPGETPNADAADAYSSRGARARQARAIGSAAFAAEYAWDNIWVWIIGPIIGAIMATLIWGLVFQSKEDKSKGESLFKH